MILDYKFNIIKRDDDQTSIKVTIYRGDFEDVLQYNPDSLQEETINRYVRKEVVATKEYTRAGTYTDDQIRKFVNNKLKDIRDANYPSFTFLSEQEQYV